MIRNTPESAAEMERLLEHLRMWNDSCKFGPHPEHGQIINIVLPPEPKRIDAILSYIRSLEAERDDYREALEEIEERDSYLGIVAPIARKILSYYPKKP